MPASLSELSMFLSEQAEWFTVGALGEAAGISGSTELKQRATELTASVAAQEGISLSGMPETAQGAAAAIKAAWGWLAKTSGKIVAKLSTNVALVATLGGVYVAYEYLTAEDQIKHEQERQLGAT
ncbi:unnamed protein product, partial [marine sediment metagenome]